MHIWEQKNRFMKDIETISPPTLSIKALIANIEIYAIENWNVIICNVPGAYFSCRNYVEKYIHNITKRGIRGHHVWC